MEKIWDIYGCYVILPQDRWETYKFMDFTLFYQPSLRDIPKKNGGLFGGDTVAPIWHR